MNEMTNWDRPVSEVVAECYEGEKFIVDNCCEKPINDINTLKNTVTRWSCCGHGVYPDGTVEFESRFTLEELNDKLDYRIERLEWRDNYVRDDGRKGFMAIIKCNCTKEVTDKAKKHFKE